MAIIIKTPEEIKLARKAWHLAADVLRAMADAVRPGMTTKELDDYGAEVMKKLDVVSAFLGYCGYPAQTCISINEVIIHGIPGDRKIHEGDIVSIDVGVVSDGFVGDNAKTVVVGEIGDDVKRLVKGTEDALAAGIAMACAGNRLGDVSHAIEMVAVKNDLSVVREYVGHGCGRSMHEEPQIPNYGRSHLGPLLKPGMVLCFEPMFNLGNRAISQLPDGWGVVTRDGRPSAHFEHMVAIREEGPAEILTPRVADK